MQGQGVSPFPYAQVVRGSSGAVTTQVPGVADNVHIAEPIDNLPRVPGMVQGVLPGFKGAVQGMVPAFPGAGQGVWGTLLLRVRCSNTWPLRVRC